MDQQEFERYVKIVAANHHLTPEEVLRDIEHCISESHMAIAKSGNAELLSRWQKISHTGDVPNAYEFIAYAARLVADQLGERKRDCK